MTNTLTTASSEAWLEGAAGRLFVRHWPAQGAAIASLVICHGFNAHSGHYARAAEVFAQRGIAVTALDLRGRGQSAGERYYVEAFDDYAADLALAVDYAQKLAPDLPLFALGHSAGGVIAVTYAIGRQASLAGLIVESWAYRLPAPDLALQLLRGASHITPHVHVLRLKREDFSRDPAWLSVLADDPFVRDEVQPVETVAALARAGKGLADHLDRLTLPILVLHGTADRAALPDGSQDLFDAARSEDKTLRLYNGHHHDLLNDLDRDRVVNDIGNWIVGHAASYPSQDRAPPVIPGGD
jgi:alpha-beta hydrolase superfamily lysophospholipase